MKIQYRCWDKFLGKMFSWDTMNAFDTNPGSIKRYFTDSDCTYMQNTNIKDKNGKDVYEGDIVEYDCYDSDNCGQPTHTKVVEWEDALTCNLEELRMGDLEFVVIGNKYQNPDLLSDINP